MGSEGETVGASVGSLRSTLDPILLMPQLLKAVEDIKYMPLQINIEGFENDCVARRAAGLPAPTVESMEQFIDMCMLCGCDYLPSIKGVGPKLEGMLHSMGFYHFDQIAAWTPQQVAWADQNLVGFKGRVSRDNWVDQARELSEGGETEFSKRAKKDGMYDE